MNSILLKIAEQKKTEVAKAKQQKPLSSLRQHPPSSPRDFIAALQQKNPAIIAEIKKASPSIGILRHDFDVANIADIYEKNGASCLSVLTDEHFFQGHLKNIEIAKKASSLPILRKDFIIDAYQIEESYFHQADCILLIVAMLDDHQLLDFCQQALEFNLAILVESHTEKELERALCLPTPLMGVNNRSLHNFSTDIERSIRLKSLVPNDKIIISESGIHTRKDIELLQAHEISTFLIGESLMKAQDIGACLRSLISNAP